MQVHLGVLVPAAIAEPIVALVGAAAEPSARVVPPARRGLFGRRAAAAPEPPAEPTVVALPADQMQISLAAFGNLPTGDVHRLADVLEEAAQEWPALQLHVDGLDDAENPSAVAVALGGDVDALRDVARGVVRTVEGLGLFVDRRRFRPALVIARQRSATPSTGDDALARVRTALHDQQGASWTVEHLSLLRTEHDAGADRLAEVRRLPLGGTR